MVASDIDAIELHQAAMQLNVALVAVTALTEIALRNAVHSHLSRTLGTEDWLRNPPEFVIWQDVETCSRRNGLNENARPKPWFRLIKTAECTLSAMHKKLLHG